MNYRHTNGRIFDIQRFSIHDGDGIRTVVFLKGCVLRCKWCCNPESQSYEIETRMIDGKETVTGQDISVEKVMEIVARDSSYYYRSGGGLTLSGGECLCQPDFARDLLRTAQEMGINTAIESMACVKWEVIESVLPYLDTYLMDIKHMDAQKHKEFTGKSNELMLENAMKVAKSNLTNLIIRVPVVPSFNCSEQEILEIAKFAQSLPNVTQIHLLPYHRLGQDKYTQLNRIYQLQEILPPTVQMMQSLKRVVEQNTNLYCQIGG